MAYKTHPYCKVCNCCGDITDQSQHENVTSVIYVYNLKSPECQWASAHIAGTFRRNWKLRLSYGTPSILWGQTWPWSYKLLLTWVHQMWPKCHSTSDIWPLCCVRLWLSWSSHSHHESTLSVQAKRDLYTTVNTGHVWAIHPVLSEPRSSK